MPKISAKWWYRLLFLLAFALSCYLLYSPFTASFFYPFSYRQEICYYSNRYQLDPSLVAAVIKVESGFQPEALSPKGARGLMQIMPSTAEWIAEMKGIETHCVDMLYNPSYNLHLGTWYLSYLLERFDYDLPKALAAYNGGQGQVKKWIEEDVWDGNQHTVKNIPFKETREYVRKVQWAHYRYEQIYGLGKKETKFQS